MIKAVVFDRDGTLIKLIPYLGDKDVIEIYPGVVTACKLLQEKGIKLFIATNQSGIARGYFTEEQYKIVEKRLVNLFEKHDIYFDGIHYCPYHPEHGIGSYKKDSMDRKPNPGMILTIIKEHQLNPEDMIMIGDNKVDVEAGKNAGVLTALVRTGFGAKFEHDSELKADYIGDNVLDVIENFVLTHE